MKKFFFFVLAILPIMFTSCDDGDNDSTTLSSDEKKAITTSIKDQILASLDFSSSTDNAEYLSASTLRSNDYQSIAFPEQTIAGPKGGNIVMSGSYAMNYIINDSTQVTEGITYLYNVTDTYNNYSYTYDGLNITLKGALNIDVDYSMNIIMSEEMMSSSMNYDMTIKGTINAKTSTGYNDDIDFDIIYKMSTDENGNTTGTVTGTVAGEPYSEVL